MKNNIYLEVSSIEENRPLECDKIKCIRQNDCYSIGMLELGTTSVKGLMMSHAYLIVQNTSNRSIDIYSDKFTAIDNEGFSYKGCELYCDLYARVKGFETRKYKLPSGAKVKFLVLFLAKNIHQIIYEQNDDYFKLKINDIKQDNEDINIIKQRLYESKNLVSELKKQKNALERKLSETKQELEDVRAEMNKTATFVRENFNHQASMKRVQESMLCKYEFIEDSEYFRIISLEEEDTVSFNREFDKSKDNYSWINKNDALISLKADNAFGFSLDGRTIIKSPVSGIFEFDKNKMIGYKEEICRIRKYPQCEKENVISELEREEIKRNIYKKERKKMIERETLDELIEEGKIFNVYTKKEGNRSTIPMDIATAVWNRDGGKCCFCGSNENLEFDHIIPISKGGATTFRNLQLLCKNCNTKKSDNI